jgi:hypothetical protein
LGGRVPAGTTDLGLQSDPGDPIGGGDTYSYVPADSYFYFLGSNGAQVRFVVAGSGEYEWTGRFRSPGGQPWAPGTYPASGWSGPDTLAWVDVSHDYSCSSSNDSITVNSVKARPGGDIRSMSLSFVQHCDGAIGSLNGTFEWLAPPADPAPAPVTGVHVSRSGSSAEVTWTNPADVDLTYDVVTWRQGPDPVEQPNAGRLGSAVLSTSTRLQGLPAGRAVTIEIWPVDASGNLGAPVIPDLVVLHP